MRNVLFAVLLISTCGLGLAVAQESVWEVPDEAKAVENPVEATDEAVTAGGALFKKHCLMCHGEAGKGDGPATQFIKPAPPDFATTEAKERMSDGEMFYDRQEAHAPDDSQDERDRALASRAVRPNAPTGIASL